MSQRKKLRLLNKIGVSWKVSEAVVKDVEKFIQTACCSGKEEKGVTETGVRLHKQTKTKTSHSLPSDKKLMLQTFKRILHEVCYCSRMDEATITDILLQDNGWIIDNKNDEVCLLCFTGIF